MSPCHFFHREFLSLDIERQSVCKTVVRFLTMSDLIFFNFEDCVPYLELYFEIFTISGFVSRIKSFVELKSASDSPGNPTIISVAIVTSGISFLNLDIMFLKELISSPRNIFFKIL